MGNVFKDFKRLSWFLGIPSSIMGLLFLVRLFFLSKNPEIPIPTGLNPTNKISFSPLKKFNLEEVEEELSKAKRSSQAPESKKVVPLIFPNNDSIYKNQLKGLTGSQSSNQMAVGSLNQPLSKVSHPDFYIPSEHEINEYKSGQNIKSEDFQEKKDGFNSYIKPEHESQKNKTQTRNILRAKILSDQLVTEGSEVQIRVIQEFYINQTKIPINTLLSAFVNFENNRLLLNINTLLVDNLEEETNLVSIGKDGKIGLSTVEIGSDKNNAFNSETKGEIASQVSDEITGQSPVLPSILSNTARKLLKKDRKIEIKLYDGFELRFISK